MKKWTDKNAQSDLVLYEDDLFIVLNKPAGVKTQDDDTPEISLLRWIEKIKRQKLHLVNRLDRPVSGVVLLSKSKKGNQIIQKNSQLSKKYVAITKPVVEKAKSLTHYILKDGKRKRAEISDAEKKGYKLCHLEYETFHQLDNYNLLLIKTFTGRFHQIRAQLAWIGYPIRGDVKYGARRANQDRSIDLHAWSLVLPDSGKEIKALPVGREKIWQDLLDLNIL